MGEPQDVLRVGIIGAGNISRLYLQGLARHSDRMQAATLCDPDSKTLTACAAEFQVERTYCSEVSRFLSPVPWRPI